jgi:ornithine carbamoyltransferase
VTRHFLDLFDVSDAEARELLELALALKGRRRRPTERALGGRTLGLLFEKPSLRTRVSFQAAVAQLGGSSIFLQGQDVGLGRRESVADFARVISQYVDVLAVRTFAHETVAGLARHATIPVINALCDEAHPCQAMADMLTLREVFGRLDGLTLAFVGDGNNVARSLAVASARLGVRFVLAAPRGYWFPEDFRARFEAVFPDTPLRVEEDPARAVAGAHAVYTDVWASMGQEGEAESRRRDFEPYRVDARLMGGARSDAVFLHCLPAHRGEEVTDEVLDGAQSRVIPEAANRLHFQKALILWLLGLRPDAHGRGRRLSHARGRRS